MQYLYKTYGTFKKNAHQLKKTKKQYFIRSDVFSNEIDIADIRH